MKRLVLIAGALLLIVVAFAPTARPAGAATFGYVFTNDDLAGPNTVTVFIVNADGSLTKKASVPTGGTGVGGGFFASSRVKILQASDLLFATDEGSGDIAVFSGASAGNLVLKTRVAGGQGSGSMGTSLVAGGSCLVAGFSSSGNLISYKVSTTSPYLKAVSARFVGSVGGLAGTKTAGGYYVAASLMNVYSVAAVPISPSTCVLGTVSSLPTVARSLGGSPAGFGFSPDGSKIYVADSNTSGTVIEEGPFPAGPLKAYSYSSGGVNSSSLLVDSTGQCLYVQNNNTPGVTAIPLFSGVPSIFSAFTSDGTGNTYAGMAAWHNSYRGFFQTSTSFSTNQVVVFLTGAGCTLTLGGAYSTGQSNTYTTSLTAYPQVGP